jgi:hypothetical protein
MAYKPILMKPFLVNRVLSGNKSQTRRIVKGDITRLEQLFDYNDKDTPSLIETYNHPKGLVKPYCMVGDVLWVRETFWTFNNVTVYKADNPNGSAVAKKWNPSLFMPKDRCRLWLKVKSVHVEELHNISDADAIKEGIEIHNKSGHYVDYFAHKSRDRYWVNPQLSFSSLWSMINGEDSWEKNPFVWVIEFEPCEMPHDFLAIKNLENG